MHNKPSKIYIVDQIRALVQKNPKLKILDVGSGQSKNFLPLIKAFPQMTYVGVEPFTKDANEAKELLSKYPNATIYNQFAYTGLSNLNGSFDVVVSLSVLEHIKNLDSFLTFAQSKAKKKGHIIHLYDLGHALYSSSVQEKMHVALCKNTLTRKLMPQQHFTSYVSQKKVEQVIKKLGATIERVTYHNMRSNVAYLKLLEESASSTKIAYEIAYSEVAMGILTQKLPTNKREKIFPSICIWARA